MKKGFRIGGEGGCVALLSALSGYPVGARLVLSLAERTEKNERFRLACLCSTSSPAFLIGVVGAGMLNSATDGWIILSCHFFAVYAVGFFMGRFATHSFEEAPHTHQPSTDRLFSRTLEQSVFTTLFIGGYVAVFSLFGQMLSDCGVFSFSNHPAAEGFLRGLLEVTGGCAILSKSQTPLTLPIICFLSTFGGACILMQQLSFLRKAEIPTAKFLLVKVLQATLSAILCYFVTLFA